MKKWMQVIPIMLVLIGCKSPVTAQNEVVTTEPTFAYKQQMENIEKGIYFRGVGNEPEWSLKISDKTIEFTSLKPGFETLSGNHVEPIRAMDANVKMYRVATNIGVMSIQILMQECVNTMSGEEKPYKVEISFEKNNQTTVFNGCGNYITPVSLHDIWVLEKLNGQKATLEQFEKQLPNLEINSSTNQFMGFAGCNQMNGKVFYEKGLLRFTNIITTRMACSPNNKENELIKALQSITAFKVEDRRLILTNPSGVEVIYKKVD